MADIDTARVKGLVLDALGIADTFGTYKANEKYLEATVDAEILESEVQIISAVCQNLENPKRKRYQTNIAVSNPDGSFELPNSLVGPIGVYFISNPDDKEIPAAEVGFNQLQMAQHAFLNGTPSYILNYIITFPLYCIQANRLYVFPYSEGAFFITAVQTTVLASPTAIDLDLEQAVVDCARARLLMKKGNHPDAAGFYEKQYKEILSAVSAGKDLPVLKMIQEND